MDYFTHKEVVCDRGKPRKKKRGPLLSITHVIHVCKFTYIYHTNQPNVGEYKPYMDSMSYTGCLMTGSLYWFIVISTYLGILSSPTLTLRDLFISQVSLGISCGRFLNPLHSPQEFNIDTQNPQWLVF